MIQLILILAVLSNYVSIITPEDDPNIFSSFIEPAGELYFLWSIFIFFMSFILYVYFSIPVTMTAHCLLRQEPEKDPILGTLDRDAEIYCNNHSLPGRIDGVTCCYPETTDEIKLKLYLYLPGKRRRKIAFSDTRRGRRLFRRYDKIVYVIHGWLEVPLEAKWITLTRMFWNDRGFPVIVVDYSKGGGAKYFQAIANVRTVGMAIGYSIIEWNIIHKTLLIGLSLGGQTIGQIGLYVNQKTRECGEERKVAECHALDPAGPYYDGGPLEAILDKSDCEVVQVIHTAATRSTELSVPLAFASNMYGTASKSGHCDYWINCGFLQPQTCTEGLVSAISELSLPSIATNIVGCGHTRSAVIYVNELYGKCNFTSLTCADCGDEMKIGCSATEKNTVSNGLPPYANCCPDEDTNYVLFTDEEGNKCQSYIQGSIADPIPKVN